MSRAGRAWMRTEPPPATMPSSTPARAADSASSMRCFFSFSSTSVAAPTLSTATPPDSLARRSWSFSRSKSLVVSSIWSLIWPMRALIAVLGALALDDRGRVLVGRVTRRAWPRSSSCTLSSLRPTSSLMTRAPVRVAMSSSMALRRSPKPGALTASTLIGAAQLVDDQRGERLTVDVLGDDQERLAGRDGLLERRKDVRDRADLLVRDEDVRLIERPPPSCRRRSTGDHVGGDVAAVELHALDVLACRASGPGDSSTVTTPSLPTLSMTSAIIWPISGSRALMAAMWAMSSVVSTGFDRRLISSTMASTPLLDAALQAHRAGAGGDVLQALGDDGLGEHDRGGGAVAGDVVRLRRDLLEQLGTHVLVRDPRARCRERWSHRHW